LARLNNGQALTVKIGAQDALAVGETIELRWSAEDCRAFASAAATSRNSSKSGRE
jgi:putative spermidine/putrescine transport system ATP-binding protein